MVQIDTEALFTYTLETRETFVFTQPCGTISEEGLINLAKAIFKHCQQSNLDCILIDSANFQGALSVTQLYYASQRFSEIIGHDKKVAYINPPPHWPQEVDEFSRNVINTRGGSLQLFQSFDQALEWFEYMSTKPK